MTDDGGAGDGRLGDDEAHVAALLAVLALAREDGAPGGEPLRQWRDRRLAALKSSASRTDPRSPHR
jgi:hypothetical protein